MSNITERLLAGAKESYAANAAKRAEEKAAILAELEAAKKKKAGGDADQESSITMSANSQAATIDTPAAEIEAAAPTTPEPRRKVRSYDLTD